MTVVKMCADSMTVAAKEAPSMTSSNAGTVRRRQRLGGMLNYSTWAVRLKTPRTGSSGLWRSVGGSGFHQRDWKKRGGNTTARQGRRINYRTLTVPESLLHRR